MSKNVLGYIQLYLTKKIIKLFLLLLGNFITTCTLNQYDDASPVLNMRLYRLATILQLFPYSKLPMTTL